MFTCSSIDGGTLALSDLPRSSYRATAIRGRQPSRPASTAATRPARTPARARSCRAPRTRTACGRRRPPGRGRRASGSPTTPSTSRRRPLRSRSLRTGGRGRARARWRSGPGCSTCAVRSSGGGPPRSSSRSSTPSYVPYARTVAIAQSRSAGGRAAHVPGQVRVSGNGVEALAPDELGYLEREAVPRVMERAQANGFLTERDDRVASSVRVYSGVGRSAGSHGSETSVRPFGRRRSSRRRDRTRGRERRRSLPAGEA